MPPLGRLGIRPCTITRTMEPIDIHTHITTPSKRTIYNSGTEYIAGRSISIGIHPWHINHKWSEDFAAIATLAKENNVMAIGECGLDTLKSPAAIEVQEEVFKAHIQLSEALQKPLIIHCVKAHDRLIALHRETRPTQAWILHGFRGKPQQANQLIKEGFYISLGEKFNPDSAKAIPTERLFIETDESRCPIEEIYASIATAKGISTEELAMQIAANAIIFGQF